MGCVRGSRTENELISLFHNTLRAGAWCNLGNLRSRRNLHICNGAGAVQRTNQRGYLILVHQLLCHGNRLCRNPLVIFLHKFNHILSVNAAGFINLIYSHFYRIGLHQAAGRRISRKGPHASQNNRLFPILTLRIPLAPRHGPHNHGRHCQNRCYLPISSHKINPFPIYALNNSSKKPHIHQKQAPYPLPLIH